MSEHSEMFEIRAAQAQEATAYEQSRPFYLLKPRLFPDGNALCALYGENIQEGLCGFGDTPMAAANDFDMSFHTQKLPSSTLPSHTKGNS